MTAFYHTLVGCPSVRNPDWKLVKSLLGLRMPDRWTFHHAPGYGGTASACNDLCRLALEMGATWLVIVGDDAAFLPGAIERLTGWEQPIVAALSFARYAPITPTVYSGNAGNGKKLIDVHGVAAWVRQHPELIQRNAPALLDPAPHDALLEVDVAGSHVMAIRYDVLETLEPPWFERKERGEAAAGEDFYFCHKARAAGFPVHVDRSVIAGHLAGDWVIGALDFMAWYEVVEWRAGEGVFEIKVG